LFDNFESINYYENVDQMPAQSTPSSAGPTIPQTSWPKKRLIILGILVLIAITLFTSIYFKIIPINFFTKSSPAEVAIQSTPAPKLSLSCPVAKEYCQSGKIVEGGEGFLGISFTLPLETSILTSFPGELSSEPTIPQRASNQPLLYLRGNQGLEAIYSFYGFSSATFDKTYQARAEIGKIGEGSFPTMSSFGGANFLFSVKKDGKFIKISPEDFK